MWSVAEGWPGWGEWNGVDPETVGPALISEIRCIRGDEFAMSPHHGRDSVGIHMTWGHHIDKVLELTEEIQRTLAPFDARPHWGKLHTMQGEQIRALYADAGLGDFEALCHAHDPAGKFRASPWAQEVLGAGA